MNFASPRNIQSIAYFFSILIMIPASAGNSIFLKMFLLISRRVNISVQDRETLSVTTFSGLHERGFYLEVPEIPKT